MPKLSNPTILDIASVLDDAVIEHIVENDTRLYVTGVPMNFWIRIKQDHPAVMYSTYVEFAEDLPDYDAVMSANRLNNDLLMIQFAADLEKGRLTGHYMLPIHDGIDRRLLLRTARTFSEIFELAMTNEEVASVLKHDCASQTVGVERGDLLLN